MQNPMQNQPIPVIAVQLECPNSIGWAVNIGTRSWTGKYLGELVQCIARNRVDEATLSLSLLLPVELRQDAPVKPKE